MLNIIFSDYTLSGPANQTCDKDTGKWQPDEEVRCEKAE